MSRDINLLNPALRPSRRLLTPALVAGATALSVFAVLSASAYEHQRLAGVAEERTRLTAELRRLQDEVKRVAAQVPATASPALIEEQARLQRDIEARRAVADRLGGSDLGNTEGFSPYLMALSRRAVNGLWITGFSMSGTGEDLSIRGRVLRPELVSEYLERLGSDEALRGRPLSGISMRALDISPAREEAKAGDGKGAPKSAPTVRVIEFVLGAAAGSGTAGIRQGERP